MAVATAVIAASLAAVHVLAGRLRFLEVIPRSRWLSFGSGISVAYVCVHILPELAEQQRSIEASGWLGFLERHVYLFALAGLSVFYGLERLVRQRRALRAGGAREVGASAGVFWIHIGSFFAYNGLIGYLLVHRESPGRRSLALFAAAMAAHFVVNDYGLRHAHRRRYNDIGRWVLSGAILLGWLVGVTVRVPRAAVATLFSFLAGGILLNVLKEELPEERESAFWAFALGAAVYAALLLYT